MVCGAETLSAYLLFRTALLDVTSLIYFVLSG